MLATTCRDCGERIWRFNSGRHWYNRNHSVVCDRSPIGLHRWNGKTTELKTLAEL